jgi:hypothetical protein
MKLLTQNKMIPLASVLILQGCLGSSSSSSTDATLLDGGEANLSIGMALKTASSGMALSSAALTVGGNVEVTKAIMNVEKIELWLPKGKRCEDLADFTLDSRIRCDESDDLDEETESSDKLVVDGPIVFDLVNEASDPSLEGVTLPSGIYQRIRIKAKNNEDQVNYPELQQNSVYIETEFDVEGTPTSLAIQIESDEDIDLRSAGGLEVSEGAANRIITSINAGMIFDAAELAVCVSAGAFSSTGTHSFVVDEDEHEASGVCEDFLEAFEEGFFAETDLDERNDDSQENDDDEDGQEDDDSNDD